MPTEFLPEFHHDLVLNLVAKTRQLQVADHTQGERRSNSGPYTIIVYQIYCSIISTAASVHGGLRLQTFANAGISFFQAKALMRLYRKKT